MTPYVNKFTDIDALKTQFGPWSAMAIDLADGTSTKKDRNDQRLRRLLQTACDVVGKPLSQCRVLDLACLEGHYAIEFAQQGAQAVGIELREANIAKAAFAAQALGLENIDFYMDDVNNLSTETYGTFDIIICSGILYHLTAQDAHDLIHKMAACCNGIMLLDTFVAAEDSETVQVGAQTFTGIGYKEHDEDANQQEKLKDLWASVHNDSSFWFTQHSLSKIVQDAGFTSFSQILLPAQPTLSADRRAYLGVIGTPVSIKSSKMTATAELVAPQTRKVTELHPNQLHKSAAFKIAKQVLPQGVKNMIKPTLRKIGVLKTKEAPAFLKD